MCGKDIRERSLDRFVFVFVFNARIYRSGAYRHTGRSIKSGENKGENNGVKGKKRNKGSGVEEEHHVMVMIRKNKDMGGN